MKGDAAKVNFGSEAFIERVVREVLRRLQDATRYKTASSPPQTETPCQNELRPFEHKLEQRVITLDVLRDVPPGATTLFAQERAVVTPAVVDELRDRGVRLIRGEPKLAAAKWVLARVNDADGPGWNALKDANVRRLEGDLPSVLRRLNPILAEGDRAVVATHAPGVAVFTAIQAGYRAVYGGHPRDVRDACDQIDANVLVVDCHSPANGALQAFLGAATAESPPMNPIPNV